MSRRLWIRAGTAAAVALALLTSFSYGFLVGRNRLFPYDRIVALVRASREGDSLLAALYGRTVKMRERKPVGHLFGRFAPARKLTGEELADAQAREIEALEAVGYVDAVEPAPVTSGVILRDGERAGAGPLLYTSGHAPEAYLIDRDGNVLHRWGKAFEEAFPGAIAPPDRPSFHAFRRAVLLEDGSLLAIFEGKGIVKLDRDSRVVWARQDRSHHDVEVQANGDILVLTREAHLRPEYNETRPVLEDYVTVLSPDGEETARISLLDAVFRSHWRPLLRYGPEAGDLLHTNTLERLDGSLADRSPAFRAGNILVSFNRISTVAVLDPEAGRLVWALAGRSEGNHTPTILPNGNLLLFDNRAGGDWSRVIEIDPFSQEVAWGFYGDEHNDFSSWYCGAASRLPNGNTMITETSRGHAFEVTPDGDVVWDWYSPHRGGENGDAIALLFQMEPVPPGKLGWLDGATGGAGPVAGR